MRKEQVISDYENAKKHYEAIGVNVDEAVKKLENLSISIHCWQADDVIGFENPDGELTGGIQTTGNYPGKARTFKELRSDLEKVFSRSEEHTSELQSRPHLVCRLLLE